jgi:hypothetical protein
MSNPSAEPSPRALGESLAALAMQVADLRGQVHAVNTRLDRAGLRGDLNLAARFEELAQTVADTLDDAAPRAQTAPYWIGLDHDTQATRLADLRRWADIVLRQQYGGYELQECWPRHTHAIWELSTLAAEWHRTYRVPRPDLARALEFYDRWLPGTMRRINGITRACMPQCVMLRISGDRAARPEYRLRLRRAGKQAASVGSQQAAGAVHVELADAHVRDERAPVLGGVPVYRPAAPVLGVPDQDHAVAGLADFDAARTTVAAEAGLPPAEVTYRFHLSSATFSIRSCEAPRGRASPRTRSNATAALRTTSGSLIV